MLSVVVGLVDPEERGGPPVAVEVGVYSDTSSEQRSYKRKNKKRDI
jgi:hypothetical protein